MHNLLHSYFEFNNMFYLHYSVLIADNGLNFIAFNAGKNPERTPTKIATPKANKASQGGITETAAVVSPISAAEVIMENLKAFIIAEIP